MSKKFLGTALKVTAGVAVAAGAVAAAGFVYGLKKWSKDEDSDEIKITTGGKNGLHIQKTEDGKYLVDTKYDWASDPNFCDDETAAAEDGGIVIDISGEKCGCEDENCACGEETAENNTAEEETAEKSDNEETSCECCEAEKAEESEEDCE